MSDAIAGGLQNLQSMSHLEELRKETEAAQQAIREGSVTKDAPPPAAIDDPRQKRTYSFDINYDAPRGQVIKGRFTNQILTIGQKITVGVMRARMQMGVSLDAMSADTFNLLYRVTWLQQSLTDKPKWAEDLLALESEGLVTAIFNEVDGHERFFHGEKPNAQAGEEEV